MKTYRINVTGKFAGVAVVPGTSPAVAVKRLLDGGFAAGYKFASVGPQRVNLAKGDAINIRVERVS